LLTPRQRLVCPLWDTESPWLWWACSRTRHCEEQPSTGSSTPSSVDHRNTPSWAVMVQLGSWGSSGVSDDHRASAMFAPCFDRRHPGHLLRKDSEVGDGSAWGLDWWGFISKRGRGGVDGTRNGQQAAAAMLPKSALSKVFMTRKPGTGLVPPLSTFASCIHHPRCADLIWGHRSLDPWEAGTGDGQTRLAQVVYRRTQLVLSQSRLSDAKPMGIVRVPAAATLSGSVVTLRQRSRFAHRGESEWSIQRCRLRLRLPVP